MRQRIDVSPGLGGSCYGSGSSHMIYLDIEPSVKDILLPTSDRELRDDISMHKHCVKAHVDEVYSRYMGILVLDETFVEGKIEMIEETIWQFIQWPRKLIKVYLVGKFWTCVISTQELNFIYKCMRQKSMFSLEMFFLEVMNYMTMFFLANNDVLIDTRMNAFEEGQTHHVES
ncbi:hypothetical protein Hanom_Chr03g00233241 [Helianthus anomalus]